MRTYIAGAVGLLILLIGTVSMAADQGHDEGRKRTFPGRMKWEEVSTRVSSLPEICRYVYRNIRYRADGIDELTSPEVTWSRGYGDCEDFAGCVVALSRKLNKEASIVVLYPVDSFEGHAIAMGRTDRGGLWMSSNGSYREVDSEDDIKRIVARDLGWMGKEIRMEGLENAAGKLGMIASR